MQQMWNRLQLLFAHGVSTLVGNDKVQAKVLDGEVLDNLARLEMYGYSYRPHPGSQAYLLFPSGDRSYGVAIMVGDKRYQMDLQSGEVSLHDDIGHSITLQRGGIAVAGGGHDVTVTGAPTVLVTGGDVVADGVSLKEHVHSGVQPGSGLSGPPVGGGGAGGGSGGGGGGASQEDLDNAVGAAEAAAVAAIAAQAAAVVAEVDAVEAKNDSIAAKVLAILASTTAGDFADSASTFASNAASSATAAGSSATAANSHKDQALTYSTAAGDSASLASTYAINAASSETAAGGSATSAATSASAASTSASNAAASAAASAISYTTLSAHVDDVEADLSNQLITQAGNHSALSASVSALSTTVGGHTSSIATLASTQDGLSARYGVTINNNGHVSGFALNSDAAANGGNPTSAFVIQADKFAIVDPGVAYTEGNSPATNKIPFVVVGGITYIKNAAIEELSIGKEKIQIGSLTAPESIATFFTPTGINGADNATTEYTGIASMPIAVVDAFIKRLIIVTIAVNHTDTTPGYLVIKLLNNGVGVAGQEFAIDPSNRMVAGSSSTTHTVMFTLTTAANSSNTLSLAIYLGNGTTNKWSNASGLDFFDIIMFCYTGKR